MDPEVEQCVLCDILCGLPSTPFAELIPTASPDDQIVARTDLFALIGDVAPISSGHLLIVPTRHVSCCARLNSTELSELKVLVDAAARGLRAVAGGEIAFFEHGAAYTASAARPDGSCAIDHAHLHVACVVPGAALAAAQELGLFEAPNGDALTAAASAISTGRGYFYVQRYGGKAFVGPVGDERPQVLRALLRDTDGDVPWNWHDQVVLADVYATRSRVAANLAVLRQALSALDVPRGNRLA